MARLLYGNFDVEHELATPHYNRPQRLARLNTELAPCLLALADSGDQIWCPEPLSEDPARTLTDAGLRSAGFLSSCSEGELPQELPVELAPWGWSRAAVAFARQAGVEVPHVDLDAVRTANSRGFSFALETSLEVSASPRDSC